MKKIKYALQPIFWIYIYLPLAAIFFLMILGYYRVTGDLEVCRLYYPEMGTLQCYMSSKTVRVPGAK